jgi:tRNA dimethylallyltransferase
MSFPKTKTVIIIVGPTAVGKTSVAIELAKYFKTEIISADSRQCFQELNTGVAKPSQEELEQVPHHFISSHSIHDEMNAGIFEQYALQKVNELFLQHDVVIMTGGTGFYIKAFCEGMDEMPDVPEKIRKKIILKYEKKGLDWLQKKIKKKDPEFYEVGEIQNPQRLMRALEIVESTGKSILKFRKNKKIKREFDIIKLGLELPREELHRNINSRVDKMIKKGLADEVKSLLPFRELNPLQTVGYSEIFDFIDGKISLNDAIDRIKKNTRLYAKRQMTWFKKDKEIEWFKSEEFEKIKKTLSHLYSSKS